MARVLRERNSSTGMPSIRPAFAIIFLSLAATTSAQQSHLDEMVAQANDLHSFSDVSISPDGRWITWLEDDPHGKASGLWLLDWRGPKATARRLQKKSGMSIASSVAWSPDSRQIAFFAGAGSSSQRQLFVGRVCGGTPRVLVKVDGYARDIRWSPDGKQIAFLYAEGGGGGGPREAKPAAVGEIGSTFHNQRIAVVDSSEGSIRQITPATLNVYEYDWSPDARRFAAIAAPGPGDNNWWIAQLYVLDLGSGQMNALYRPPAERQLALPAWSPDGKEIAFLGGLMSDEGFNGGDLFLIPSQGGAVHDLTKGRTSTPTWFTWRKNQELLFTEDVEGGGAISRLKLDSGQTETLWRGEKAVHAGGNGSNFALATTDTGSVVIESSWEKPPEVWAGSIGNWRQITNANAAQRRHWGRAESIVWQSDGFDVQGWLLYPEHYDPARRYPMIVSIHGGPTNVRVPSWPRLDVSLMAGLGYFVFFPNPRGSYGEGEAFTLANVKDFGGGDLRDILVGIDAVLKKVPVDSNRLGVTGWSYGGFMTMWTITQTNRFRAAMAGAGIADWLSYYGQNSIDEWLLPFFGSSVYDDPEVYAKRSPITYIKHVNTPTLVIVGERDGECPTPQSFEFWHALKTLKVPTELVVYAGEGHLFHNSSNEIDRLRRTVMWFNRYLQGGPPGTGAD